MDVNRGNIELHIEQIILDGFQNVDQSQLVAAIERELTRLSPQWSGRTQTTSIDGGTAPLNANGDADAIGTLVAQSINRGLTE